MTNGAKIAGLAAALVSAVAAMSAARANPSGEPVHFVEGLSCTGGKFGMQLPATLPRLLAMAPVLHETVLGTEHWEGYTATHKRVEFDGLTLEVVAFSNEPNRYLLSSAFIRGDRWSTLSPFKVGDPVEKVRAALGPVAETDDQLRSTYTGESESVHFDTKAGKVSGIVYACYTG